MRMKIIGAPFFRYECSLQGVYHYSATKNLAPDRCPRCDNPVIPVRKQRVFDEEKGMEVIINAK